MRISVEEACRRIAGGGVVAIPTETVYGLAASLLHPEAIQQIFFLKKRPADNPLIIHLPSPELLSRYTISLPPHTHELVAAFWPGPLTLVLPSDIEAVPWEVRAGLPTAAFRVPSHPFTREILHNVGPLVAPSANLSGRPSSTSAAHVEKDFGDDFPVVEGGICQAGVESTILFFNGDRWNIARLGAIAPEALKAVLGYSPSLYEPPNPEKDNICPGRAYRHYAPAAKLVLGTPPSVPHAIVGFSDRSYPEGTRVLSLGPSTSPEEINHNLYSVLRQLDEEQIALAWVDTALPRQGLYLTLLERLQRAAS